MAIQMLTSTCSLRATTWIRFPAFRASSLLSARLRKFEEGGLSLMDKAIYLDIELCVGCGACVVACMDQNDIYPEKGQPAFRRIYRMEEGEYPLASIQYISTACMHCEDSPCVIGCPTGAITKDDRTGAVMVNKELCIRGHNCALACPFGGQAE